MTKYPEDLVHLFKVVDANLTSETPDYEVYLQALEIVREREYHDAMAANRRKASLLLLAEIAASVAIVILIATVVFVLPQILPAHFAIEIQGSILLVYGPIAALLIIILLLLPRSIRVLLRERQDEMTQNKSAFAKDMLLTFAEDMLLPEKKAPTILQSRDGRITIVITPWSMEVLEQGVSPNYRRALESAVRVGLSVDGLYILTFETADTIRLWQPSKSATVGRYFNVFNWIDLTNKSPAPTSTTVLFLRPDHTEVKMRSDLITVEQPGKSPLVSIPAKGIDGVGLSTDGRHFLVTKNDISLLFDLKQRTSPIQFSLKNIR